MYTVYWCICTKVCEMNISAELLSAGLDLKVWRVLFSVLTVPQCRQTARRHQLQPDNWRAPGERPGQLKRGETGTTNKQINKQTLSIYRLNNPTFCCVLCRRLWTIWGFLIRPTSPSNCPTASASDTISFRWHHYHCVHVLLFANFSIVLNASPHSHIYVLEKSQHKVPEEALKVSFFWFLWGTLKLLLRVLKSVSNFSSYL